MNESTETYGEFDIIVHAETNPFGAWIARVSVRRGTTTLVDVRPATVQPQWRTEPEATRDGIEWGRRFIDRELDARPSRSWVSDRAHAENWFRDAAQTRSDNDDT
ncbi:hypothetical protein LFL96_21900 [Paraburkholderia sp. D15]|uniref:DUF6566 family protein n=1 Tax=Paraburkholderia sp. D15 TaxID=2880218 RepID=UPI00247A5B58|nr:DUF6566 family protein [Paraburkholderia sp. D15]WGS53702.1 hypothetical protein LFL96_21900 [Paraburkholderia sp. D15]